MLNNIKDTEFGAVGDDVADDRPAIQSAIQDAVANRKGGILVPAGTYRLSRTDMPGGHWSLDLNNVQDFMIQGEGPRSVLKLADTNAATGDWHVIILRNDCHRVVLKDLVIDGNHTGLTEPDEQSHGIEVENGTEDLVLDRCILRQCFGDGVRLVGAAPPGGNIKRIRIENCLFQANRRSGLGIQRALEQILVAHCIFDGTINDQSIDFEPTGSDGPTDLIIDGCIINHLNRALAVTLSGISGGNPLTHCKFTNNLVLGGGIFCTDIDKLTIQNNTIRVTDLGAQQRIPVQIQRGGTAVMVTDNLLINDDSATRAVISISEVNQRPVTRTLIANNICFTSFGRGIECRSCDDISIDGNLIVATGSCTQGVFVDSETSSVDAISVRNNDITLSNGGTWITGIHFAATEAHPIGHVSVVGNSIRGPAEGIRFKGSNFQRTPICTLNRTDTAVTSPVLGLAGLPENAMVVGGATSGGGNTESSGAGRFVAGLGDPNGTVVGNVGDIFQRLDGSASLTLYVKETGDGTREGWVGK